MTYIEDSFACIAHMRGIGNYYEKWEAVRSVWATRLDKGPVSQKEDYTPHNHTNHNVGIYKILSEILIPKQSYGQELNAENLFILNLAVLFHDLMMTYTPSARSEHGKAAKIYILSKFKDENFNITLIEQEAIADVILGHSDIKGENGTAIDTISLLPESSEDFPTGLLGRINTPLLAALLRLADELDIHSGRIDTFHYERREIKESSIPHWRKCAILKYPQKKGDDVTVIQLVPDKTRILADGNLDNDIELLIEVRSKVLNELRHLNYKVFNKGYLPGWHFVNIELKADGEILEKIKRIDASGANPFSGEGEKIIGDEVPQPPASSQALQEPEKEASESILPIAPEEIQNKISQWVVDKDLLKSGHFKIDEDFRVRDWIDSQALLEDGKCLDYICTAFAGRLNFEEKKYFFIGVDHYGLLVASVLGMKSNTPFSYIISKRLAAGHVDQEKEIKIPSDCNIILITDVIITMRTISACIDFIVDNNDVKREQIDSIFSIFLREQVDRDGKTIELDYKGMAEKLYVLNKSFHVERCNKSECIFLKQGKDLYTYVPKDI